jgi:integrase
MALWKTEWGWRAELMMKGERIRSKGFFKYKDEARQWIKEEKTRLKADLKNSSLTDKEKDQSLWSLSQKYLADCKVNYSEKTFGEKKFCLERFYDYVGDVDVTMIEPLTILNFINERAKNQSNNAANKDRKNLKAFYQWVQEMTGIMYDPTAPIKKKAHSRKPRRLIPIQDILKVILAAQGHDRVLIGAYWHTGARKSEVLRWTWADDINFEERWVRLGTKKTADGSMAYEKLWMNEDLYSLLMWQWKNRHATSPYVFCHNNKNSRKHEVNSLYGQPYIARNRLLYKLCKEAEVDIFGFHDIRHTMAKYLNDLQKVGLKKVQQVLRHNRQTTTEIYVEGNYTGTKEVMKLLELNVVENFK